MHAAARKTARLGAVAIPMQQIRAEARLTLTRARLEGPAAEADALLAAVLDQSRGDIELAALLGRTVEDDAAARIRHAIGQRARRVPLQHIVGIAPFAGLDLAVGPGVFVPRPETETLVELAVSELEAAGVSEPRVADLGSGSGAISLGVAAGLANRGVEARVVAVEASPHAWPWLVRNVRQHGHGRVRPIFDRIGSRALPAMMRPFDALLSNPPYIPRANEPRDPEVRSFDPGMALYGGEDGLDVVRELAVLGLEALRRGGVLIVEHDDHHGDAARAVLRAAGYRGVTTHRDLAGRERFTSGRV